MASSEALSGSAVDNTRLLGLPRKPELGPGAQDSACAARLQENDWCICWCIYLESAGLREMLYGIPKACRGTIHV